MKITIGSDATHVNVTVEAETPQEGFQIGVAVMKLSELGIYVIGNQPVLELSYPKRPPDRHTT